jgi:hypothetical protein
MFVDYHWEFRLEFDDESGAMRMYDTYKDAVSAWALNLHAAGKKELALCRTVGTGYREHGDPPISYVSAVVQAYELPATFNPDSYGHGHPIPDFLRAQVQAFHKERWREEDA